MLSIDANLLLYAFNNASPWHETAHAWLTSIQREEDITISEFILAELYYTRSALTMTTQGVTELATVNVNDFEGLGFRKVWNPMGD